MNNQFSTAKSTLSITGTEQKPQNTGWVSLVRAKVDAVKGAGFGEVRIIIKNGAIHRVVQTIDEMV